MTPNREGRIDTAALRVLTHRLADNAATYAPDTHAEPAALPGRTPGEALARTPRPPVGPRAVIMDCGISRQSGYTHVLWIAGNADQMVGTAVVQRLGAIVSRVVGVEAYSWEGDDRLHLRAPGLPWDGLLHDAQDALADFLAAS